MRNPSTLLSLMKVLVRSLLCQTNQIQTLSLAQLTSIQNHPIKITILTLFFHHCRFKRKFFRLIIHRQF